MAIASVSGGVWRGSELFDSSRDDAVLKLRFEAGTNELPIHAHEDSERFIVALSGQGTFYLAGEPVEAFSGCGVREQPVRAGDVLCFARGLTHTFAAGEQPLVLLSYHGPYIALDDARQYTLPPLRWCPGATCP